MDLSWQIIDKFAAKTISAFADELNVSPALAKVLLNRGIDDIEEARKFYKPDLNRLHDPFLMHDMKDAVQRIEEAIRLKQNILIYGDYDVDGTTAISLLLLFFRQIGIPVEFYVPDRLTEGYGLTRQGIRNVRNAGAELIITVDCGITSREEVDYARSLGIDVIICDHHFPGAELPEATAVLNPKRADCSYPFKELAGVGVAFKLAQALQQKMNFNAANLFDLLDLVAIGSAADIVPLIDENRIFVKFGLDKLNNTSNLGLQALKEITGLAKGCITAGQVVFVLAPRINAVGRLGDAGRAVRLLTSENKQQAENIAEILESENKIRREIDESTLSQALAQIEDLEDPGSQNVFVLNSDDWHPGVIGIVASRIVERYFRPTVMIATENGSGKGSARSIPGFDIYQALKSCEDLMNSFGGHKYAAGLTIGSQNIPEFRKKLDAVASQSLTAEMTTPKLWIDAEIALKDIDEMLIKLLKRMAPYGPQNMRPVFQTGALQVVGTPSIVGNNHLKFKVRQNDVVFNAIGFNLGDLFYRLAPGESDLEMVYSIDENEWNGKTTIQLKVKDLR